MSKTAARIALACAIAGLAASGLAAYTHFRLLSDPSYLSFCDVSATVSCTQVYSSRFGSVGGISVSVFGVIWFAFATLLAAAGVRGSLSVRESVSEYLFAGSTVSLAAVFYLGYASFVLLHLVCILCLFTYVAVIGLFLVTGASSSMSLWSLPRRIAGDLRLMLSSPQALALAALFVAGSAATLLFFPRHSGPIAIEAAGEPSAAPRDERAEFEAWYTTQPRVTLDVPAEGAAVVVVKFNDYQCPPCRQTYMEYQAVFARFTASRPGMVRYVVRDFPLESECNAGVTSDLHSAACEAAVAVRLAREHGRAEALEAWLFENQPSMTAERVVEAAREVGQVTDFAARYASTLEAVRADIAFGRQHGVRATPTFFINGVMIPGGLPPHLFEQALEYELQRAGR